jgi:hypothetical protein
MHEATKTTMDKAIIEKDDIESNQIDERLKALK